MPKRPRGQGVERRAQTRVRETSFGNFGGRHNFAQHLPPLDPHIAACNAQRRQDIADALVQEVESKKRARLELRHALAQESEIIPVDSNAGSEPEPPAGVHCQHTVSSTESVTVNVFGEDDGAHDVASDIHDLPLIAFAINDNGSIDDDECHGDLDDTQAAADHAIDDIVAVKKRMSTVLSWDRLLAYLCITGPTRLTAGQYTFFAAALQMANEAIRMRTYKTVRGKMWSELLVNCFPKSSLVHVRDVPRVPGRGERKRDVRTINAGVKHAMDVARVVLPSEWAKLDVCMFNFYSEVYEHPDAHDEEQISIEKSRLVQRRAAAIGHELVVWATMDDAVVETHVGDRLMIPCSSRPVTDTTTPIDQQGWALHRREGSRSAVDVEGILGGLWCIVTDGEERRPPQDVEQRWTFEEKLVYNALCSSPRSSVRSALQGPTGNDSNRRSGMHPRLQKTIPTCLNPDRVSVNPGDVCAFIRPLKETPNTTSVCVLIASPIAYSNGGTAERLVWISTDNLNERPTIMDSVSQVNVTGLPKLHGGRRSTRNHFDGSVRNKGFLMTGERYVVYRFALYADGFKQHKSLSDTRSVGGVYMLPLGLTAESRRSTAAARVLSIASSSQSLNDVISLVLDDVAAATVNGVTGTDPFGHSVRIFLDPVAFFGDYPAAAATSDVIGHTGNSFCTHCTIPRRRRKDHAEIVYSSNIHSRRLGYMRFDERMRRIRALKLSSENKKVLGMKNMSADNVAKLPCVDLGDRLMAAANSPLNDLGQNVVDVMFESCLSGAAVPDHLLTGLAKNVLHLCFKQLRSDEERGRVELQIVSSATANGLPFQGVFLTWDKSGKWNAFHSVTMSEVLCLILCGASVFDGVHARTGEDVFKLPRKLQDLISRAYYMPSKEVDGQVNYTPCTGVGEVKYHGDLHRLCRSFLDLAAAVIQEKGEEAKAIDKPNAHRALELCIHTIPNFGHASNCSEMVLEQHHQDFKGWLEKNTNADSHLTAVEKSLGRHWLGRLYSLYMCWSEGDERERKCAEVGLRRLFLGEQGLHLDYTTRIGGEILQHFRNALKEAFRQPVLGQLRRCGHAGQTWRRTFRWEVLNKVVPPPSTAVIKARRVLNDHYRSVRGAVLGGLEFFRSARFVSVDNYDGRHRSYPHHTVMHGAAVSVVVDGATEDDEVLRMRQHGDGELKFFAVVAMMKANDGDVWGIVRQLEKDGAHFCVQSDITRVLEFENGVRRVGLIHACDRNCIISRPAKSVQHSASVLDGGLYSVLTRRDGYPPHLG